MFDTNLYLRKKSRNAFSLRLTTIRKKCDYLCLSLKFRRGTNETKEMKKNRRENRTRTEQKTVVETKKDEMQTTSSCETQSTYQLRWLTYHTILTHPEKRFIE